MNEVERAFAALSRDADQARLAPAGSVRKRADRRLAVQAVTGAAVVAVLVAGVTVGARMTLTGSHTPGPAPAASGPPVSATPSPSVAPSVSAPGSSSPTTPPPAGTSSAPARAIPKSIPARAFLQAGDVPGTIKDGPTRLGAGDQPLPEFCGSGYGQGDRVGIRATQVLSFAGADAPADSTPDATIYEDVIVYRGDQAGKVLDKLRAAVRACPAQKAGNGVPARHYLRGSIGAGDESVLIEQTRPAYGEDGEPVGDGSLDHLFWVAVRVNDSVAFVSNTGYESVSAKRDDTVHLGERAAARLGAWRP